MGNPLQRCPRNSSPSLYFTPISTGTRNRGVSEQDHQTDGSPSAKCEAIYKENEDVELKPGATEAKAKTSNCSPTRLHLDRSIPVVHPRYRVSERLGLSILAALPSTLAGRSVLRPYGFSRTAFRPRPNVGPALCWRKTG